MTGFIGEYECKLDAKARFMLPSGLRKQLDPEANEQFVVNRGYEGCLTLYPSNEWEKTSARLGKLNLFIEKNRKFYRQFHNGAKQLALDGTGRLLIPKPLMSFATIAKEIVLFAYADRIEIWAKERYEQYMGETKSDFEELAEEVMGENNNDEE